MNTKLFFDIFKKCFFHKTGHKCIDRSGPFCKSGHTCIQLQHITKLDQPNNFLCYMASQLFI